MTGTMRALDRKLREECRLLRSMTSEEACDWLIARHPTSPQIVDHRSWAPREQNRLLHFYTFGRLPHAAGWGYEKLLKITSVQRFARAIEAALPDIEASRMDLLAYYLFPALRDRARTPKEKEVAARLMEIVSAMSEDATGH